jgi:hypothetical protein
MYFSSELSGMTGHYHIFGIWSLKAQEQTIETATSDTIIRDRLYWLKGRSDKLDKELRYFEAFGNYSSVSPEVSKILNDVDFRYAYEALNISSADVTFESIWLCSPNLKELVYLSAY